MINHTDMSEFLEPHTWRLATLDVPSGRRPLVTVVCWQSSVRFGGDRPFRHSAPILRQPYWLPVRQRVQFKIAVLVFQRLSGNAPTYLADDCQLISDVSTRRLCSTDTAMCVVQRSAIDVSQRLDHACGNRCPPNYDNTTLLDSSNGCLLYTSDAADVYSV